MDNTLYRCNTCGFETPLFETMQRHQEGHAEQARQVNEYKPFQSTEPELYKTRDHAKSEEPTSFASLVSGPLDTIMSKARRFDEMNMRLVSWCARNSFSQALTTEETLEILMNLAHERDKWMKKANEIESGVRQTPDFYRLKREITDLNSRIETLKSENHQLRSQADHGEQVKREARGLVEKLLGKLINQIDWNGWQSVLSEDDDDD